MGNRFVDKMGEAGDWILVAAEKAQEPKEPGGLLGFKCIVGARDVVVLGVVLVMLSVSSATEPEGVTEPKRDSDEVEHRHKCWYRLEVHWGVKRPEPEAVAAATFVRLPMPRLLPKMDVCLLNG